MASDGAVAKPACDILDLATHRLFDEHSLSESRLLRIMKEVINSSPMASRHWCFLIDALDECDDEQEILDLVQIISNKPWIKVCIASRAWPRFAVLSDQRLSLRMQDCTYHDIRHYAIDQLRIADFSDHSIELGTRVADHAEGVFIWAILVTKRIIEKRHSGASSTRLEALIHNMPNELSYYYQRMLDKLAPETVIALFIIRACEVPVLDVYRGATSVQPVVTTTLISSALSASTAASLTMPIKAETGRAENEGAKEVERLLSQGFQGLVTVDIRKSDDLLANGQAITVTYLHKTAHDFLEEYIVQGAFGQATSATQLDPHLALLRALVLDLKALDLDRLTPFTNLEIDALVRLPFWVRLEQAIRFVQVISDETSQRYTANIRAESFQLLEEFDRVLQIQLSSWSKGSLQEHWSSLLPIGSAARLDDHGDNLLSYAASRALWAYISHKLERGSPLQKPGKPLLFYAIQPQPQMAADPAFLTTIKVLFDHGAHPDVMYRGESAWQRFLRTYHMRDADHAQTRYTMALRRIYKLFIDHSADANVSGDVAAEVSRQYGPSLRNLRGSLACLASGTHAETLGQN